MCVCGACTYVCGVWSCCLFSSSERRYLTEAGPEAFDHAHKLYIEKLYQFAGLPPPPSVQADLVGDSLYALQGAASPSYQYREVCPCGRGYVTVTDACPSPISC